MASVLIPTTHKTPNIAVNRVNTGFLISGKWIMDFKALHSTKIALTVVINDLFLGADRGDCSILVLSKLGVAFHMIDHGILLNCLQISAGIKGLALSYYYHNSLIENFMSLWVTPPPQWLSWIVGSLKAQLLAPFCFLYTYSPWVNSFRSALSLVFILFASFLFVVLFFLIYLFFVKALVMLLRKVQ